MDYERGTHFIRSKRLVRALVSLEEKGIFMTASRPQRLISDMRNVRYGEVLLVFAKDDTLVAEVYGTQMLNDCPAELWDTLNADEIVKERGALFAKLNGPRHWCLDGLGTKVAVVEPIITDFNGLTMRRIATIDLKDAPGTLPYTERFVNRGSTFFWDAGSKVWELVNPEGKAYVMQALCIGVDPTLSLDTLDNLGSKLNLPAGWTYRSRILEEELISDTTNNDATVVQDEFENTYTVAE